MKRFSLVVLAIPLLSIVSMAQTPSPSVAANPSPSINQTAASPSPSPIAESKGIPSLPWIVEMFASGVMLVGVFGAFWSLKKAKTRYGTAIGPRHIQFVSVCLIVPTILILGLEKVLTSETTATLIGGLAGYLLSGLGTYEPSKPGNGKGNGKRNNLSQPAGADQGEDSQNDAPTEQLPESPDDVEIEIKRVEARRKLVEDRLRRLKEMRPRGPVFRKPEEPPPPATA